MSEQGERREIWRFFKHSTIYAIGNVINRVGAFLLLPVYTRFLSTGEYGSLELFYAVMAVISGILSVGLAHATLRFYFEFDNERARKAVVSTNLIASLVLTVAGGLLLAPLAPQISGLVFGDEQLSVGILIILATIVFELSSQVALAYVRAIEYSHFYVYVALAKLIVQVLLNSFIVIVLDGGVIGVLAGNLATVLLGWVVLTGFTVYRCGLRFDLAKLWPVLGYSLPFLGGTLVGLVNENADRFLITQFLSLSALGLYALAVKLSLVVEQLVGEPFNRAYGAYRFSIMKSPMAGALQARISNYLFLGALIICLWMSVLVEDLLSIMSSDQFLPAALLVPPILLATLMRIMSYPMQTGILYAKKTRFVFYITLLAASLSLGGNLWLIPLMGIQGAIATLVLVALAELLSNMLISHRYFPVSYPWLRWLALLIVAAAVYGASQQVEFPLVASIVSRVLLLLVASLLLLRLGLPAQDRSIVMEWIGRYRSRGEAA